MRTRQLALPLLAAAAFSGGCQTVTGAAPSAIPSQADQPPNIVFIMADDLGWMDTGVYGSTFYETPNIDRLAERGVRFTNAYSANPLCSPTRASILTGLYPARVGLTGPWAHAGEVSFNQVLARSAPAHVAALEAAGPAAGGGGTRVHTMYYTYAEALKDAGYATGHFGKWHAGPEPYSPLEQGFDVDKPHWHGPGPAGSYLAPWAWPERLYDKGRPGEHIEDRMADEAVAFLRENADGPFLLNYWAFSVHSPYHARKDVHPDILEKYIAKIDPDNHQHNAVMGAMVETFDANVGRLVDELDALGVRENTIVIFFSDNGGVNQPPRDIYEQPEPTGTMTSNHPLREGKASVYEGGVRVPMIVDWPGVTAPGTVSDALTMSQDLYPTMLEMAGVELVPGLPLDGQSIVPALRGGELPGRPLFVHFPHGNQKAWPGFQPATTVRDGDWKLIRFYCDTTDQSDRLELYNLADDIGEENNVASLHPGRVASMNAMIDGFLEETGALVPVPNPNFDPVVADEKYGDSWRNPNRPTGGTR